MTLALSLVIVSIDAGGSAVGTSPTVTSRPIEGASAAIDAAPGKTVPAGADKLGALDSVTGVLRGLTITDLSAYLASLSQTLTNKTVNAVSSTYSPSNSNWNAAAFSANGGFGGGLSLVDSSTAGWTIFTTASGGVLNFSQGAVGAATGQKLALDSSGVLTPAADNSQTLGAASFRWSTVFAGTGTINTSDAREKTAVAALSDAEIAAAQELAAEVGTFRFLDAIEKKGDAARRHVGLTVQRAIAIMESHGLDAMAYGFICHDQWEEKAVEEVREDGALAREISVPATEDVQAASIELIEGVPTLSLKIEKRPVLQMVGVVDAGGQPVMVPDEKTGHAVQLMHPVPVMTTATQRYDRIVTPAGDRYGFRADELNLFLARGQKACNDALRDRIAALEARA